jgi:hypothetical protein
VGKFRVKIYLHKYGKVKKCMPFQTSFQNIIKIYSNQSIVLKIYSKHFYNEKIVKSKGLQENRVRVFSKVINVTNKIKNKKPNIFNS